MLCAYVFIKCDNCEDKEKCNEELKSYMVKEMKDGRLKVYAEV